ncbi:MAG: hypothetical protein ACK4P4_03170 [Allorhizobium sp.]
MQLKLQRSQREGGVMSKSVIFCLDARVEFNAEEAANLKRYKMLEQVIYTSEGAKKAAEGSAAAMQKARGNRLSADSVDDLLFSAAAGIGGGLKAAALGAVSAMKLRITVNSLQKGQHIECKSLDELLGAESAVIEACKNLRVYLDTAATFDGREVLIDFSSQEATVVASAPAAMLIAPSTGKPEKTSETPSAPAAIAHQSAPQQTTSTPIRQAEPFKQLDTDNALYEMGKKVGALWTGATPVQRSIAAAALAGVMIVIWLLMFGGDKQSTGQFNAAAETEAASIQASSMEAQAAATSVEAMQPLPPPQEERTGDRFYSVAEAADALIGPNTPVRPIKWYRADGQLLAELNSDDFSQTLCAQPTYDRARDVFVCP